MSLQEKLKATAQELVQLLEQSENQHQEFIKERDARLGSDDPPTDVYIEATPMGFIIETDITIDLLIEKDTRNIVGVDINLPDGTEVRLDNIDVHDLFLQAGAKQLAAPTDNGKEFTSKVSKDPHCPKADASEERTLQVLEAEITQLACNIGKLIEDHLQASLHERNEKEGSREHNEKMTSLWNRLLDFDAQIASAVFSNRPQAHLKMLAARLVERY